MRRLLLPLLLISFLICSCKTTSLEGSVEYLQALGGEGEIVVTVDAKSFNLKEFIGDDNAAVSYLCEHMDRVSFSLRDPSGLYEEYPADLTQYEFYGAIEGDISKSLVNAALSLSGQFDDAKSSSGLKYYKDNVSGIEIAVPSKGTVLFSSSDVDENYSGYYCKRDPILSSENVQRMKGASIGIFISNPKTMVDLGIDLPKESLENIQFILATTDMESISIEFKMKDESLADSFSILIKAGYVGSLRKEGRKVDVALLKNVFTKEFETVSINQLELTEEQKELIEGLTKAMLGIL